MELINLSNNHILAERTQQAQRFWKRFKGLMFTTRLPSGCALHIQPCRSIHTFFMNYPIDVLYLNKNLKVVAIDQELRAGKIGKTHREAASVVELPSGTIAKTNTRIGQTVQFKKQRRGETW